MAGEDQYSVCEVVNLSNELFTWMWDGREYSLAGRQKKHIVRSAALHGRKKSIYRYDPNTEQVKHRLAIVGEHKVEFIEISPEEKIELIDRSTGGVFGGKVEHQKIGNFEERGTIQTFGGHTVTTGSDSAPTQEGKTAGGDLTPTGSLKVDESEFADE